MAKQLVEGGQADCVLAVGFEKMEKGSLKFGYEDRANPLDQHLAVMVEKRGYLSIGRFECPCVYIG